MSLQLLSLPVETLDTVISFIVHPIDAYNLSRTCKYLRTHLESQSNLFWYSIMQVHITELRYDPYVPKEDYYLGTRVGYLRIGCCHFCFARTSPQEKKWLQRMGVGEGSFRDLRVRACVSCFVENTISMFLPPNGAKEQYSD